MSESPLREIERRINALSSLPAGAALPDDARDVVGTLLDALEAGSVRSAEKDQSSGVWRAVPWVKQGILLGFRMGQLVDMSSTPPLRLTITRCASVED